MPTSLVPRRPLKTYKPKGGIPYKVKDGDNWRRIARARNMDVWELIYFNFHTKNPEIVNYYMNMYVGCTEITSDYKNYRFSSNDNPGIIYIPQRKTGIFDLYIYDISDTIIWQTAEHVKENNPKILLQGIVSLEDLLFTLNNFNKRGCRFNSIYFDTHGSAGTVRFKENNLYYGNVQKLSDYSGILTPNATIIFGGCHVGEGSKGWNLLERTGMFFAKNGFVAAATSVTLGLPIFEPRIPKWGFLRIIQTKNGKVISRTEVGNRLGKLVRWLTE